MAMSQMYVLSNGAVGVGTTDLLDAKFKIVGNKNNGPINEFTFKPANPGPEIGAWHRGETLTIINFWHTFGGWNELVARKFTTNSDSTLKTDILPIKSTMPILKQINAYSYYYKSDDIKTRQREYGVLAQEIEEILPELVVTTKGTKHISYHGFIPFLIEAVKEQQNEIEMLQKIISAQEVDIVELREIRKEFKELQEMVSKCCENSLQISTLPEMPQVQGKAILFQNTPNPFTTNTEIVCNLPETTKHAMLYIYNLQGVELKSYPITQTGLNTITVNGSELPAGMYLYTLVVNNEIIDTKRMILTK